TREIDALKNACHAMAAGPAVSRSFPLHRGVHDGVDILHQAMRRRFVSQHAALPFDGAVWNSDAVAVAAGPVPATQLVAGRRQLTNDVPSEEPRASGDGNPHR